MANQPDPRSVFVVHGRNEELRRSMFDFLRNINLRPLEWTEAVALTNNGSPYIGEVLDAAFDAAQAIVVLMTPDEIAYLQPQYSLGESDPEIHPQPQARPNVLFEAGMALGRNPNRTVLVEVGEIRPFSDVAGRHAVRLTNDVAKRQDLAARLQTAGCDVDLTGVDWHSSGDFTAPGQIGSGLPLGRRVPGVKSVVKPIDIFLKYVNKGGTKIDKLQVINRGTETAFEVTLNFPNNAALKPTDSQVIHKIPGGGQMVTINVINHSRMTMGGTGEVPTFDVEVSAKTESGELVTKEVFMDTNS